jgi:hypothetical protein
MKEVTMTFEDHLAQFPKVAEMSPSLFASNLTKHFREHPTWDSRCGWIRDESKTYWSPNENVLRDLAHIERVVPEAAALIANPELCAYSRESILAIRYKFLHSGLPAKVGWWFVVSKRKEFHLIEPEVDVQLDGRIRRACGWDDQTKMREFDIKHPLWPWPALNNIALSAAGLFELTDLLDRKDKRQELTALLSAGDGLARMTGHQLRDKLEAVIPKILRTTLSRHLD